MAVVALWGGGREEEGLILLLGKEKIGNGVRNEEEGSTRVRILGERGRRKN